MARRHGLRYKTRMEDVLSTVFAWIGANENVLSGLVAIAVLGGLLGSALRTFAKRASTRSAAAPAATAQGWSDAAGGPALDQEIRYATTADGVRIAYAVTGAGSPIVRSLGWFTHLELEWSSPLGRSFWQRLSRNHRLIRYDGRGMGLSQSVSEFSAEKRLYDLEAVVDAAGVERFALVGTSEGCRTALRYAAKHPQRVTHLILYGAAVWKDNRFDGTSARRYAAYYQMMKSGWTEASHRKLFSDLFLGESATPAEIEYFMAMQTASASQEIIAASYASQAEPLQGFELAAQLRVPTLILHPREDRIVPFQNSLDLAAEIPGARLRPLEGDCHWLLMKSARSEEYINAIEGFLAET